jgi:hypothetical protein
MPAYQGNFAQFAFLASFRFGAAAATSGAITIPAREQLLIQITVATFAVADIPALRFNADAGANYYSRYISAVAGGVVFVNNPVNSTSVVAMGAVAATGARSILTAITNNLGTEKICTVSDDITGTGAVATSPTIMFGGGSWVNTAAQITSVELRSVAGNNFNAGSSIAIYGINP